LTLTYYWSTTGTRLVDRIIPKNNIILKFARFPPFAIVQKPLAISNVKLSFYRLRVLSYGSLQLLLWVRSSFAKALV